MPGSELLHDAQRLVGSPADLDASAVWAPTDDRPVVSVAKRRRLTIALCGLGVGVLLILLATIVFEDVTAVARVAIGLAGLASTYIGFNQLCRLFRDQFDTSFWLSVVWMSLVIGAAVLADWLPLAESKDVSKTLTEPTLLRPDLFSRHPLGTDRQGLDVLGGVVYGGCVSLVVGIGAVLIGMTIGGLIGMAAGYFRGRVDSAVSLVTDSTLAFPPLILLLGMVAVLQPNVRNVTIALAMLGIPTYIRLSRANTMGVAQREYVLAARALGATNRRVILRELLPNVILPIASFGFIVVGALIVAEASLSFLGLSIQRPTPTWGNMIAAGQAEFEQHPHLVFIPGTVLFLTVFAINRIGEKARHTWNPRRSAL